MREEEYEGRSSGAYLIWAWVGIPVAALAVLLAVMLFGTPRVADGNGKAKATEQDREELAQARASLAQSPDLEACKTAIGRLNAHLRQHPEDLPAPLSSDEQGLLKKELGLSDGDLAELASPTFTPLDAFFLEECLLLRDAAASLEAHVIGKDEKEARLAPLELAEMAFAWTCRQVRLGPSSADPAHAAFVLRRGWGTPVERARVFLALLAQLGLDDNSFPGLQGCVVKLPDPGGEGLSLWCCGVAIGGAPGQLYLFDPIMGLPIPGPGGKGVATLEMACTVPEVLGQLGAGTRVYPVSSIRAREARLGVVCPLTAASARMRTLQDGLLARREQKGKPLPSPVRVKLHQPPQGALAAVRAAAGAKVAVGFEPGGASSLRASIPVAEGGSDAGVTFRLGDLPGYAGPEHQNNTGKMPRSKLLEVAAVPWSYFPPELNKREDLRFDWGVGAQLRNIFASHFLRAQRDPSSPREMLLRGKLGKTTSELIVKERDHWHRSLGRAMPDGLEEWLERARNADLLQARAESGAEDPAKARQAMQALLKWRTSDAISVLMTNAIAAPRAADLTYQMGLCMHERGVRAEALAALSARAGTELPDERQRAREAWEAASGWWEALLKEFPNDLSAPMARRLLGESLARLGRADEARKAWSATGPPSNDLEQLGDLWLARRK